MENLLKNFDVVPFDVVMIIASAALFVVLYRTMGKFVFGPYLDLIESRERATIGAEGAAATEREQAQTIEKEYQDRLMAARVSAMEKKIANLNSAKAEADAVVEKAEGSAQELLRSVRWEMARQIDETRNKTHADVDSLAEMIVERVKNPSPKASGSNSRK
jgi:F-type H+-transporting ATPase subunit b